MKKLNNKGLYLNLWYDCDSEELKKCFPLADKRFLNSSFNYIKFVIEDYRIMAYIDITPIPSLVYLSKQFSSFENSIDYLKDCLKDCQSLVVSKKKMKEEIQKYMQDIRILKARIKECKRFRSI